jgi:hypothetical protein
MCAFIYILWLRLREQVWVSFAWLSPHDYHFPLTLPSQAGRVAVLSLLAAVVLAPRGSVALPRAGPARAMRAAAAAAAAATRQAGAAAAAAVRLRTSMGM